jgi:hypothetical protein
MTFIKSLEGKYIAKKLLLTSEAAIISSTL